MRHIFLTTGLGLLTVTAFAAPARAALTIAYQRGGGPLATLYVDGNHMRVENPERNERETAVLIDAASKRVTIIDDRNKTYMEMTEADRQRMRAQMDAMRAQMQERMKNMPPEQRARIEGMMGPAGPGGAAGAHKPQEWTFKPLGQKKTINGFACEMYEVSEDGKPREEDCISPWSAGLVKKEDFAAIAKFAQEMVDELGSSRMAGRREGIFGRLEKAPGLPISRVPIEEDGQRGEEEQVKSIKRGSIPASVFATPAGYAKKEVPMMMGGHHHGPPGP